MSRIMAMTDEEWFVEVERYRERLNSLRIPIDVNPSAAKGILSRIDTLFSEVRLDLSYMEGRKEYVENIIREIERVEANGSNEMARKQNASLAVQNFQLNDGGTENLYAVLRTLIERTSYLQGVVDVLYGKQSRLITTTGLLKLEKDLLPFVDNQ